MEFVKIEANALRSMREQIEDLQAKMKAIKKTERNLIAELQIKFGLTPQQAQTLAVLIQARGCCVSRSDIAKAWGPSKGRNEDRSSHAVDVTIDRYMKLLREKLGRETIAAVYGQGFCITKNVGEIVGSIMDTRNIETAKAA